MVSPGWEVLAEMDKHLAPRRMYVTAGGLDNQIAMIYDSGGGNWKTLFYLSDHLGSVLALATPDGDIVESYEYEPYGLPTVYDDEGETVASRTSTVGNRFMFTGREWEPDGEFYHYRHRTYSPHEKRFMQRDPIGLAGGWNVYAYCGGDPVIASDPMGLAVETTIIAHSFGGAPHTSTWLDIEEELVYLEQMLSRYIVGCKAPDYFRVSRAYASIHMLREANRRLAIKPTVGDSRFVPVGAGTTYIDLSMMRRISSERVRSGWFSTTISTKYKASEVSLGTILHEGYHSVQASQIGVGTMRTIGNYEEKVPGLTYALRTLEKPALDLEDWFASKVYPCYH